MHDFNVLCVLTEKDCKSLTGIENYKNDNQNRPLSKLDHSAFRERPFKSTSKKQSRARSLIKSLSKL